MGDNSVSARPYIAKYWLIFSIKPMRPRLLLFMADACNFFPGQSIPQLSLPQINANAGTLKHLLLDYSGEILAANAEMVHATLSSWQRIMVAATKLIRVGHAKEGDLVVQQPQFETYYLMAPQ
jgi:hypothetical protein